MVGRYIVQILTLLFYVMEQVNAYLEAKAVGLPYKTKLCARFINDLEKTLQWLNPQAIYWGSSVD